MPRRRNPLAFWLAVIATVFNLLLPLVAQGKVRASVLADVCTTEGSQPSGHQHCSACAVGAEPVVAPGVLPVYRQSIALRAPFAREALPQLPSQYPTAHSRAPPPGLMH